MKLMTAFSKKGYYFGRKYLVFKSYGNKVKGVLQSPALEDTDGYIVDTTYSTSLDESEQLAELIRSYSRHFKESPATYRVFDENGEPYDVI